MPLFKTIIVDIDTKILIWKITETYDDLSQNLFLTEISKNRLDGMKSKLHQLGFLAVRKLLENANYTDQDLFYDSFGKPHLIDKKCISISHSHQFATIIISTKSVGIDIEKQREKIIDIANKFVNKNEFLTLNAEDKLNYIKDLTIIWGAKEAIFKIVNQEGISFKNHIIVDKFNLDSQKSKAVLNINEIIKPFEVHYEVIEDFILVYCR